MSSSNREKQDATAPQPIPSAAAQNRRNSFTGWSHSIFSMPSERMQQGASGGVSPPIAYPLHTAHTFSGKDSATPLPGNAPASTFSGIGIFRRLSTSQAQQHTAVTATPKPTAAMSALDNAVGMHGQPEPRKNAHPLTKTLEEVRSVDDTPPSRPDSRMRNLMLSGQFLL
ncbi:hypothetical protein COEREDRAFT_79760 [Coemansia reversa NRRL 1564]|uniref:Uncharacterized protein n=1 Tax=Coemansia reversa (strain ATCC 12441 / NRRL 1564) TaxID=763665 RepID=A0A2G5BIF0_COERN|nr:hypothetical protein COEREDRAFT_79760 [Coemansia reversa NRRL 1564]|eukprot:PIA18775.1 hypothetical protein COEREDRAFT_79760 [Coemansia reversa NRRL 1564]